MWAVVGLAGLPRAFGAARGLVEAQQIESPEDNVMLMQLRATALLDFRVVSEIGPGPAGNGTMLASPFAAKPYQTHVISTPCQAPVGMSVSLLAVKMSAPRLLFVLVAFAVLALCLAWLVYSKIWVGKSRSEEAHVEQPVLPINQSRTSVDEQVDEYDTEIMSFPEDMYSLGIASFVRDLHMVARRQSTVGVRITRITSHICVVLLCMAMQIGILVMLGRWVVPQQLGTIRDAYDTYEFHMYGGIENHTTLTVNGRHRGIDGYFQPELFESLDAASKQAVCNIPFSQLLFLFIVLFIWTLTCFSQIKACFELFVCLIISTPTVNSMSLSLAGNTCVEYDNASIVEGVSGSSLSSTLLEARFPSRSSTLLEAQFPSRSSTSAPMMGCTVGRSLIIIGLPLSSKLFITVFILLPWLGTVWVLLLLGCRWLVATNDFGALVANAVALEFILTLKNLVYETLVPARSKRDLLSTRMRVPCDTEPAGYCVFLSAFLWGVSAIAWVYLYIDVFQAVLPEYRWDSHMLCSKYLGGAAS